MELVRDMDWLVCWLGTTLIFFVIQPIQVHCFPGRWIISELGILFFSFLSDNSSVALMLLRCLIATLCLQSRFSKFSEVKTIYIVPSLSPLISRLHDMNISSLWNNHEKANSLSSSRSRLFMLKSQKKAG